MWEAVLFGVLATSSLVAGGVLGSYWDAPKRVTGVMLAFASGAMVSALAFELFPEAVELGGVAPAGGGLLAGAAVFVVVNTWLDSRVAPPEEASELAEAKDDVPDVERGGARRAGRGRPPAAGEGRGGGRLRGRAGPAGRLHPRRRAREPGPRRVSLADQESAGGSLALLAGIFAANFPEALVGAVAMRSLGRSVRSTFGLWLATALLLIPAVVIGRVALAGADPSTLAFPLAFAGGAVLAALADTLMPEAFERGRPFNAFATCAGFFLAFVLAEGWLARVLAGPLPEVGDQAGGDGGLGAGAVGGAQDGAADGVQLDRAAGGGVLLHRGAHAVGDLLEHGRRWPPRPARPRRPWPPGRSRGPPPASSSQCPARASPKGAAVQVVTSAIGASTASLDQRVVASSSRTVTSRPVSASRAPSSSTRSRGALPAASSTTANGEACSITPGPTRVDSTRMVPATTWSGG